MKTIAIAFALTLAVSTLNAFAQSTGSTLHVSTPVSADGYLVSPWDYEGQTIKLNVAFVKPAHFESPLQDIIFYHAMTMTADRKPGGEMLIAVPKTESEHFARYYGMDFHGNTTHPLSGTLLLAHRPHPPFHEGQPNPPAPSTGAPATSGTNATSSSDGITETSGTNANGNEPVRRHRPGVWFVDYKGLSADLFDKNKGIELPEMGGPGEDHPHPGGPRGR